MKPPTSFLRSAALWCGLLAAACSVDNKGLGAGDSGGTGASVGTGGGSTASGGRIGSTGTGGAPASTGGTTSGGAPGTGGHSDTGSGGMIVIGTGGDMGGDAGAPGTGGAPQPGTGGAAQPGTGGAPLPGTGGAASGGAPMPGTGGRGTGGAATGGAGTGGAPVPTCNANNCANGCCMGNMCITNRNDMRCGSGGAACAACGACFSCSNAGACTPNDNARWDLICVSATITPMHNFSTWDPVTPNMPLPDPYCRLTVDGNNRTPTSVKNETLMPVWNESISGGTSGPGTTTNLTTAILTAANPRWSVSVLDEDGGIDDVVCSVSNRLTPAELTAGGATFTNRDNCQSLTLKVVCAN